jgi:hypothetical protein
MHIGHLRPRLMCSVQRVQELRWKTSSTTASAHRKVVGDPAQAGDQEAGPVELEDDPVLAPRALARQLHSMHSTAAMSAEPNLGWIPS